MTGKHSYTPQILIALLNGEDLKCCCSELVKMREAELELFRAKVREDYLLLRPIDACRFMPEGSPQHDLYEEGIRRLRQEFPEIAAEADRIKKEMEEKDAAEWGPYLY